MRAAICVRVSTQYQSLDNQLPDLERPAQARGITVVETFSEKVSAAGARPQLDTPAMPALVDDARRLLDERLPGAVVEYGRYRELVRGLLEDDIWE